MSRHRTKRHATSRAQLVREAEARALKALRLMRSRHLSLTAAARESATSRRTVQHYAGSALRESDGRYTATATDTIPRVLRFITPDGLIALKVRSARSASRVARYLNAVNTYVTKQDPSQLAAFRGKQLRTGRSAYPFITSTRVLDRLADAGEVRFEELYVLTA